MLKELENGKGDRAAICGGASVCRRGVREVPSRRCLMKKYEQICELENRKVDGMG